MKFRLIILIVFLFFLMACGSEEEASVGSITTSDSLFDINLSATSIGENLSSGTIIGSLSTSGGDVGDTFTYSLVSGTGSTHNGYFSISGSNLLTAAVFDFETQSSYSIRIQTTESSGATYQEIAIISVTDLHVQEAYIKADNNDPGDKLGGSISLSGNTLAVAASLESSDQTTITTTGSDNDSNNA